MGGARTNHGHHARSQLPSLFGNTWDQEFESPLLQRRVSCEPEDDIDIQVPPRVAASVRLGRFRHFVNQVDMEHAVVEIGGPRHFTETTARPVLPQPRQRSRLSYSSWWRHQ